MIIPSLYSKDNNSPSQNAAAQNNSRVIQPIYNAKDSYQYSAPKSTPEPAQPQQKDYFQGAIDAIVSTAKSAIQKLTTPNQTVKENPAITQNKNLGQTQQPLQEPTVKSTSMTIAPSYVKASNIIDTSMPSAQTTITSQSLQTQKQSIFKAKPETIVSDYINSVKDTWKQEAPKVADYFKSYNLIGPNIPSPTAQGIGKGLEATAGAANIGFSPVSSLFGAAEHFPVIGDLVKSFNLAFTKAGEGATFSSNKLIDSIPNHVLSQKEKDQIKPGMGEIAALATQILLGKATEIGGKHTELVKKYGEKDAATIEAKANELAQTQQQPQNKGIELSPAQARIQVQATDLGGTPAGDTLLKAADQAEKQGKNLNLSYSSEKAIFSAQTPKGATFHINFVDPTQIKLLSEEGAINPTQETPKNSETPGIPVKQELTTPTDLKPEEKPFYDHFVKNKDDLTSKYVENNTKGNTLILNVDNAKELFKEQGYNDMNIIAPNKAAGKLVETIYDKALQDKKGVGNNTVLEIIGGTGAGKSTTLKSFDEGSYPIVLDNTGAQLKYLTKQIAQAIDNGFKAHVVLVLRDPVDAWENGVLHRSRHVPVEDHIQTNISSRDNFLKVVEQYKNNPNVTIDGYFNKSGEAAKPVSIDFIKNFSYDKSAIRSKIGELTQKHYDEKTRTISEDRRKQIISELQQGRREQSDIQGAPKSSQGGIGKNPETKQGNPQLESKKTASKIASSVERKAIEQKLTSKFEHLAGYDKITIKEQAEKAANLMANLDQARRVIRGEEELPKGLRGTALITAAEEYIKKTGDAELAHDLANSPLISETSAAAQEMRLAAEREPDSLAAKLKELKKAKEDAVKTKTGKTISEATKNAKSEIKTKISKPNKYDWKAFTDSIQC